jgi:hypothetical protein
VWKYSIGAAENNGPVVVAVPTTLAFVLSISSTSFTSNRWMHKAPVLDPVAATRLSSYVCTVGIDKHVDATDNPKEGFPLEIPTVRVVKNVCSSISPPPSSLSIKLLSSSSGVEF